MLFITNRLPKKEIQTGVGRKFDFDLNNNAVSNFVFFCERTGDQAYSEIGGIEFFSRLKQAPYRQILVYIHGYSSLPKSVFSTAQEFQALCDDKNNGDVLVVPLIWPCDNDFGIIKNYWDDQKSADASAYSFAQILEKYLAWRNSEKYNPQSDPCLKRINVLAHSMGNRVLRETLSVWDKNDLADGIPLIFRNTFLVAPDIVNESLQEGERGKLISHASQKVIVYHASGDLALRISKASNLKNKTASRRLGQTGPKSIQLMPANVYAVDCNDINNVYDKPIGQSYFKSGRTKGQPGLVFEHIFAALTSGRVFPQEEFGRTTVLKEN